MSRLHTAELLPVALGSEEEIRFNVRDARNDYGARPTDEELQALLRVMDDSCPPLYGNAEFRENGSRTYFDGMGLELCTPEVTTPAAQLKYRKAVTESFEESLASYLAAKSTTHGRNFTGIYQRRVHDGWNNTWGYHDNLSVADDDYAAKVNNPGQPDSRLWVQFLRSRSIMTGAGLVDPYGMQFSQKLSVPTEFNEYGYAASYLRVDDEHGQRLEIRCNDVNLHDWAYLSRVGGAALVLAASQTALGSKIADSPLYRHDLADRPWNAIPIRSNLELYPGKATQQMVDMQHFAVRVILDDFESYTNRPLPPLYRKIGQGILRYCEDFDAVIHGHKDLEILADRTDWAAKLSCIRRDIARDPDDRELGDARSQDIDFLYDRVTITAQPDGSVKTARGFGHTLAVRHAHIKPDSPVVRRAKRQPPKNTRAAARTHMSRRYGKRMVGCTWQAVSVLDDNGETTAVQFGLSQAQPTPAQLQDLKSGSALVKQHPTQS